MKSIFKLSLILIILVNSVFLANCSKDDPTSPIKGNNIVSNTNFTAEDSFSYAIAVAGHSGLSLESINGTVVITEVSGSNFVSITGVKRVESESTEDAELRLQDLMVDVQDLTNEVLVRTVQPKQSGGRNYIVHYTITLPKNMDIKVNSVNGRVILDEILGSVSVDVLNGLIEGEVALTLDGTIDMDITNGSIDLDIPQTTSAEFTAQVTNGNISVSNLVLQNRLEISKLLSGTLGDGRGTILLTALNGEIMVSGF